ncbi:MAG: toprim domain-containing protein [Alphaproteobacteria bacterium]
MTLGNIGDGAVRLAPVSTILGLGEGVETSLSAMQMFGVPCWAVLGRRFANVALPEMVREVLIFADHDNPGIEAALRARDAFQCQGRKVTIHLPAFGNDFNDDLTALSRHAR